MSQDAWNPEQYDVFKKERSQPFFDLMALIDPIEPGGTLIDLGCGTGELTFSLHKKMKAATTTGVDNSVEMLKKAEMFTSTGLQFENSQIETFRAAEEFDLVFSNAAIQWCGNHAEIFKNLEAALKKGGQLAVQMPMNHDYPTHVLAKKMSQEKPWVDLLGAEKFELGENMLTVEEYARLLYNVGFDEQKVFVRVYGMALESRDGVVEWVKGTLLNRFKSRLSADDYETFVKEFKERLFLELPNDQPFFYPFKRILMWARKA
jgi:trans-aconitate 2-methyltransferase